MSEVLKGKAAKWGVGALTFSGVVISSTTGKIQSMDFTKDSEMAALDDESGETIGESFFNHKHVINISVIPIDATTIATARTNLDAMLPDAGTTITLSDPTSTVTDGTNSGKYNVISAKEGRTNKGYATIDMQIRQFKANDTTTAIS